MTRFVGLKLGALLASILLGLPALAGCLVNEFSCHGIKTHLAACTQCVPRHELQHDESPSFFKADNADDDSIKSCLNGRI